MIAVRYLIQSVDDLTVRHDVSCVFEPGKNNLIIGQCGSGNTVLMNCLIGLIRPDKGQILYNGRDITSMTRR